MNILVAGVTGFVRSHPCDAVFRRNAFAGECQGVVSSQTPTASTLLFAIVLSVAATSPAL